MHLSRRSDLSFHRSTIFYGTKKICYSRSRKTTEADHFIFVLRPTYFLRENRCQINAAAAAIEETIIPQIEKFEGCSVMLGMPGEMTSANAGKLIISATQAVQKKTLSFFIAFPLFCEFRSDYDSARNVSRKAATVEQLYAYSIYDSCSAVNQ